MHIPHSILVIIAFFTGSAIVIVVSWQLEKSKLSARTKKYLKLRERKTKYLPKDFYAHSAFCAGLIQILLDVSKQKYQYQEEPLDWITNQLNQNGIQSIGSTKVSRKTIQEAIKAKLDAETTEGFYLAISKIVDVGGL